MSKLSPAATAAIERAVENMFTKAKARFTGKIPPGTPKGLILTLNPSFSINSLFKLAAKTEGVKSNDELFGSITKIATNYLDAAKEKAKAKMLHQVQSFLTDAHNNNIDTDVETVLNGKLTDLWGEITSDVKRIVATESTTTTNMSLMDAITKINAVRGITDPTVAFLCVHDASLCLECKKLHLLSNFKTPRVWKLSECGSGYHKKGDSNPKLAGLHPNERCYLITVMPGFGFNSSGMIEYISPGYDVFKDQRGIP